MIPVTKPFMPPKEKYEEYLLGIWNREYLTNDGPLVKQLEKKLKDYLQVDHLLYVSNGTIALQLAIKALNLKGEIITTPFSYVATTSSIVWEGCEPVFVDIDPQTLNIDPSLIEEAITDKTSAILATHVFGNPCEVESIQTIADKYGLKVIYDAAHCFGTKYKGESIFLWGDISTTSFHATKLFHTVEGGAIFTKDPDLYQRMIYMRNFGHAGPEKFNGVGINAKNSEFHAAMGLCNLEYIDIIIERRKAQFKIYNTLLMEMNGKKSMIAFNFLEGNKSYYPIVFENEAQTLKTIRRLEANDIKPRRYFYPGLNELNYIPNERMFNSDSISERIICLPLYHDLTYEMQEYIISILSDVENNEQFYYQVL